MSFRGYQGRNLLTSISLRIRKSALISFSVNLLKIKRVVFSVGVFIYFGKFCLSTAPKVRFPRNIRLRKHRVPTDSRYSSISPSGSTIFTVRLSKSMPAMNSSTAGTRIRLPPISTSKRGLASLS